MNINVKTKIPENLEEDVKLIISGITGMDPAKIGSEVNLYNELGIDSIKGIELVVALQEKYNIRIKDTRIPQLNTVKAVAKEIKQLLIKGTM